MPRVHHDTSDLRNIGSQLSNSPVGSFGDNPLVHSIYQYKKMQTLQNKSLIDKISTKDLRYNNQEIGGIAGHSAPKPEPQKPSVADTIPAFNLGMQRDLLNRVKYNRGAALRGPELKDILPRVDDKFTKLGELLFPGEEREPYEHPTIKAARIAEEESKMTKKQLRKKKKEEAKMLRNQMDPVLLALPATGKEKLTELDSMLITKPEKMISLSCFSRPENFAQKLKDKEIPYPSFDIKRKTQKQLIAEKLAKMKQGQSLMAQLAAATLAKKKSKKNKDYTVEIWNKDPTGEELKEMAELTECFEENGIEVDQNAIRRAVVNENTTKYMTLIEKDLQEDRNEQKEKDFFTIQQRQES